MSLDLQATAPDADRIISKVKSDLAGTLYEVVSLRPLAGGSANFIFHGVLAKALDDGTTDVVVKHGEAFVATQPSFPIPTARCVGSSFLSFLGAPLPSKVRELTSAAENRRDLPPHARRAPTVPKWKLGRQDS